MGGAEQGARDTLIDVVAFLRAEPDLNAGMEFVVTRCAGLPRVGAAGIMVEAQAGGRLTPVASSDESVRSLQEFARTEGESPVGETFAVGLRIDCPDLAGVDDRWPRFGAAARELGCTAVHTVPMLLFGRAVGVLTLATSRPEPLLDDDLDVAQALADAGSLAVAAHRARRGEQVAAQLQTALHSRIVIEQAKGMVAERLGLSVDEAFEILRTQARRSGRKLRDVAAAALSGHLAVTRRRG